MRILVRLAVSLYVVVSMGQGQTSAESQRITILRRGSQSAQKAAPEHFVGSVQVESLFAAKTPGRTSGSLVMFEKGSRTAWHTHPLGQVLIVTAGIGRVQRWGDPADEIRQAM